MLTDKLIINFMILALRSLKFLIDKNPTGFTKGQVLISNDIDNLKTVLQNSIKPDQPKKTNCCLELGEVLFKSSNVKEFLSGGPEVLTSGHLNVGAYRVVIDSKGIWCKTEVQIIHDATYPVYVCEVRVKDDRGSEDHGA